MERFVKIFCIILAVTVFQTLGQPSRIKRQGFSWGDDDNTNTNINWNTQRPSPRPTPQVSSPSSPSSNAGTTTTTPSPAYSTCIRQCPTTPQYNPICGTNRVTYNNESHLRCAVQCGLNVQRAFGGTCQAL